MAEVGMMPANVEQIVPMIETSSKTDQGGNELIPDKMLPISDDRPDFCIMQCTPKVE